MLGIFEGVDLILHLGDMGEATTLDQLEAVAPVLATRGADDPRSDPRMAPEQRVIEAGALAIGAVFDLTARRTGIRVEEGELLLPKGGALEAVRGLFGREVACVAFGSTHRPVIARHEDLLFVNPGSPTLPADGPGTVAVVDLDETGARARIVEV